MKLKKILEKVEKRDFFTSRDLEEVKKRKKQLHAKLTEGIVIFDRITNAGFIFYVLESTDDFFEVFRRRNKKEQEELLYHAKTLRDV